MKLPQEMHPEFGYLHPSSETRRTLRVALAAAAFGIVVGVGGTLAMTGPRATPIAGNSMVTVGHADRAAFVSEGASTVAVAHTARPHKWRSGRVLPTGTTDLASAPAPAAPLTTNASATSAPAAGVAAPITNQASLPEAPAAEPVPPKKTKTVHKRKRREDDGGSAFASPYRQPYREPAWQRNRGWW